MALIILLAVVWRRIHPTVALWTIVIGCGSVIILFIAGSNTGVEPVWPAITTSIITLAVGSIFRKPSPFKGADGLEIASPGVK